MAVNTEKGLSIQKAFLHVLSWVVTIIRVKDICIMFQQKDKCDSDIIPRNECTVEMESSLEDIDVTKTKTFETAQSATYSLLKSIKDTATAMKDNFYREIYLLILLRMPQQWRLYQINNSYITNHTIVPKSTLMDSHITNHNTIVPKSTLMDLQDVKLFYESFESVSLTMGKSTILIRGRGTQFGQSEVCVVLKPMGPFTIKQLEGIYHKMSSALRTLSCYLKKHFKEDELAKISGRTPLVDGRFEEVYPTNDDMTLEHQRFSSFVFWSLSTTAPIQELVEAGFYSSDPVLQTVECFSCGLSLSVSELHGRRPLDIHREMVQHCPFLLSENVIRERTFNNNQLQRFEPITMNGTNVNGANVDETPHVDSPISQTNNKIDRVLIEDGASHRRQQRTGQTTIGSPIGEMTEKMQNRLSINRIEQSHVSQPSNEIADGRQIENDSDARMLLSGTNKIQPILTDSHSQHSYRRDNIVSHQENANNGEHIQGAVEGATAAISPSSLAQDSSTPPPRNPRYEQEAARRESFNAWNGRHGIDRLIEAGLFYTGDQDIVRCFHCDIGLAEWNREDDPWQEHARHSHECHFLVQTKGQAYVNEVQREWSKVYSPKRPELSHVDKRQDTFHNNWPSDFVVQTPRQLAIAGFYYAGMTDTVRCHYCDGGLREWEPGDVPWVEHAKWFPHCKFVLKIKGLPFIQQCVARRNEVLQDPVPNNAQTQNEVLNRLTAPINNENRYRAEEERNPMSTAAAQAVIAMGYTTAVVAKCINAYIANTGQRNFGATDLMSIILDKEDEGGKLSSDGEPEENEINCNEFQYDAPALLKMNENLKMEQLCIDCMTRRRQILFQPCGHYLLCDLCAKKCTHCLRCDTKIKEKSKIYLS